ncbi:hypothetical protein AWC38_SpisGene25208 [Stylophora pistillata]|uniref:Uncharacterized protein n=1 Tax=Stylophora pistillata TaxID=50429 RepID=A0A2B4R1Y4_STYPI|nr:hypothetical protein AWC38_SpisGene25208 [Stylophora pistillata]
MTSKITRRKLGGTLSDASVKDGMLRINSVQRSHIECCRQQESVWVDKHSDEKNSSYGDFRDGKVYANDQCLGSSMVQYGGQYKSTDGSQQAECSGNIQSANKSGFWCDSDTGDGSEMMIGGGESSCARADHGIGITEANRASFDDSGSPDTEYDFGFDALKGNTPSQSYSLNLWIR